MSRSTALSIKNPLDQYMAQVKATPLLSRSEEEERIGRGFAPRAEEEASACAAEFQEFRGTL